MFSSFIKSTLRGMRRHFGVTSINVVGLSSGFLASFLILLWVQDELAFDQHYEEVDRVHRVMRIASYGEGQVFTWPAITAKLDDVLDEEYPEIEMAALMSWTQNMAFRRDQTMFREEGLHAGPDFFSILSHEFLAGDPATALDRPEDVVVSVTFARKYFPEAFEGRTAQAAASEVMGQSLVLEDRLDVTINGVYRDVPAQATFRPDFVLPMEEFARRNDWIDDWGNNGLRMMVKLAPDAEAAEVTEKIRLIVQDRTGGESTVLFLQPLTDVYLRSDYENGVLVGGRIDYVRIFTLVAIFVLLIAAINFTNLATARSAERAREVGVRKTFGSGRWNLASHFILESVVTALAAFLLATVAVMVLLPWFNDLTAKEISLGAVGVGTWLVFLGIALGTGVAAGWYPALHLSSFSVIGVLRRNDYGVGGGISLRRTLVVFQFAMSVILIIGAGTVSNQLDYIRSKNLGLNRQDVFYSTLDGQLAEQYDTYRARMLENPAIQSVSASSHSPLSVGSSTAWGVRWEGREEDSNTLFNILRVSHDYVETMQMSMAAGRDYSHEFGQDTSNVVINQTAARAIGFEDPIGQTLTVWGRTGQIVGVVEDFHFRSLYDPIDPLVMRLDPEFTSFTFIRPAPGRTAQALAHFGEVFREFNPQSPLVTRFLDAQFEETYRSETVIQTLARWFMVLAVFVACLGLFGLASFTASRRTKEIGVRKVLGASVPGIVGLLSREFVALVLLSFVMAYPLIWYVMSRWLEQFAYHADMSWQLFTIAGIGVLALAYVTVGYQAVRAARVNPARSLRSE